MTKEEGNPLLRKQANLCVRNFIISARENMALVQPNKPLPSAFQRPDAPECDCLHPKKVEHRKMSGAMRSAITKMGCIAIDSHPPGVLAASSELCAAKDTAQLQRLPLRANPDAAQEIEPQPAVQPPRGWRLKRNQAGDNPHDQKAQER